MCQRANEFQSRVGRLSELGRSDDTHLSVFGVHRHVDQRPDAVGVHLSNALGKMRRSRGVGLMVAAEEPLGVVGADGEMEAEFVRLTADEPDEMFGTEVDRVIVSKDRRDDAVRMHHDVLDRREAFRRERRAVDIQVRLAGSTVRDDLEEVSLLTLESSEVTDGVVPSRVATEMSSAAVGILKLDLAVATIHRRGVALHPFFRSRTAVPGRAEQVQGRLRGLHGVRRLVSFVDRRS